MMYTSLPPPPVTVDNSKVEKFMEKGIGKLLGDISGVGLAFDIYFIEQDIEQLAALDLSDPEDVKLLPLRIIDLGLDVGTTILSLVGTLLSLVGTIQDRRCHYRHANIDCNDNFQ